MYKKTATIAKYFWVLFYRSAFLYHSSDQVRSPNVSQRKPVGIVGANFCKLVAFPVTQSMYSKH